jgi:hypothetical protein
MLALHPETVDLSQLPPKGEPLVGIMGKMAPQDSTAEFGSRTLAEAAEAIVGEVRHRLDHQELYRQHGSSLQEGLWRKK